MAVHRPGFYYVIIGTFLLFLAAISLAIVAALNKFDITTAILPTDPISIYEKYPIDYDVPGWFFFYRIPTLAWQLVWLCYGLSTLCRLDLSSGGYLYYAPPYMPITMYAMFGTAMISLIAWVFAFSYGYVMFGLAFQAMISFTIFMSMSFGTSALYKHAGDLARGGQMREIGITRGLVHNGLAMYSGYMDFLVTIGLGKVLVHFAHMEQELVGIIVFSVYLASIVIFFIVEITVWDKYARYVVMHYVSAIFGLVSIATQVFDGSTWSTVHYILVVTLAMSCIALAGKLIAICVRDTKMEDRLRQGGTSVMVKN